MGGWRMIELGTKTQWGEVACIGRKDGERYYMMVDDDGVVTLMPDDMMETTTNTK